MSLEIERKFIVLSRDFKKSAEKSLQIRQIYLFHDKQTLMRIRFLDDKAFLTIKKNINDMVRHEFEYPVPKRDALHMMDIFSDLPCINKTRHLFPWHGMTWEIDEFHGRNEGLLIAEIELKNENQSIEKPSWLGKEVTGDAKYFNVNLSEKPYSKWKNKEKES